MVISSAVINNVYIPNKTGEIIIPSFELEWFNVNTEKTEKSIIPQKIISVKDLAQELKKTSNEVIKKLFGFGIMATINNNIDFTIDNVTMDCPYKVAFMAGATMEVKPSAKLNIQSEMYVYDKELNTQPSDSTKGYYASGNIPIILFITSRGIWQGCFVFSLLTFFTWLISHQS